MFFVNGQLAAAVAIAALLVSVGAARAADKKLVPFPEDEPRETKPAEPGKTRLPLPKKSTFEPRFKTPAVRRAQHQEPAAREAAARDPEESADPSLGAPKHRQARHWSRSVRPTPTIRKAKRCSTRPSRRARLPKRPTN